MSGKNLIISRNPAKKRRTAAQKAASKRNIKRAQAANRGGRRRAPAKRRRTSTRKRSYKRRSNPRGFKLPSMNRIINDQMIPALWGGAGAVGNDMLVNMLPLPAEWKSGWMRHLSKAAGAIAIGVIGSMVFPKRIADSLGAGAMTVIGYNVVRDLAAQFAPELNLGEYLDPMGEYLDPNALGYYGAGLNPEAIPGSGLETGDQFTRGSPYIDTGLDAWPTGSEYSDIEGEY